MGGRVKRVLGSGLRGLGYFGKYFVLVNNLEDIQP
jgi:hypothetical protein